MMKLNVPTLEDFRLSYPKPIGISGVINEVNGYVYKDEGDLSNGWISPIGTFFKCEYGGHECWSDIIGSYWTDIVTEECLSYNKPESYESCNERFCKKYSYSGDMPYSDYLISQGWMKWQDRGWGFNITKGSRDITRSQWSRIGWLCVYLKCDIYKFEEIDI